MFINKIGYEHIQRGVNNHDFGFETDNLKCVVDGCSEGLHSEVGAKLFCYQFKNYSKLDIEDIFNFLIPIFPDYKNIRDYLLFTILYLTEDEENFYVNICGDGNIIKQKHDNSIEYKKIGVGNAPKYIAYNYISPEYLTQYIEGVCFDRLVFSKSEYKAIGLATDGLDYILDSPFKDEFEKHLIDRKEFPIRRLINREHKYFKDDITIIF